MVTSGADARSSTNPLPASQAMASYPYGNHGVKPYTMTFHPHEQRALAARPVVFADKKRPRRQVPMDRHDRSRPPNDRWGLDPDDLCRRLYNVIAEREGRPVVVRDAQGRTEEERAAHMRVGLRERDQELAMRFQAVGQVDEPPRTVQASLFKPSTRDTVGGETLEEQVRRKRLEASVMAEGVNYQRRQMRETALSRTNGKTSHAGGKAQQQASAIVAEAAPLTIDQAQPSPRLSHSNTTDVTTLTTSPQQPTRGPKPQNSQNDNQYYRHIPQVAAAQFERTTTVDSVDDRGLIHKLSQPAMDFHMAGPEQDMSRRKDNASPLGTMHSMERVRSHRDREYDRNQFQHPPILEELAAHDDKQFRLPLRQTFETHFGKPKDGEGNGPSQRFSVGSTGRQRDSIEVAGFSIHQERAGDSLDEDAPQMKWRVDWTQSDEARPLSGNSNQAKLRKTESKWTLKGKLPSFQKSKENTVPVLDADQHDVQSPKSPKSPKSPTKSGFFGRFKR